MKLTSGTICLAFLALLTGCGSGSSGGNLSGADSNVLLVTVNGSLCGTNTDRYFNKPCVSVTVCEPGTSNCQEIIDILLDTGSSGLRIFKQVVSVSLTSEKVAAGTLGECQQWGDETSDWGPVAVASVILGNEPAVQVPIQLIDSSFGTAPSQCSNADDSPATAGFNGILGVGPFAQDCGLGCVEYADNIYNNMYYACNGSSCVGTTVALSKQVQNPMALLPKDNNGFLLQFPTIPADGAPSVNGSLVLGIGTQSNNVPSGVSTYEINPSSTYFTTTFEGYPYDGFLDTGSNALFFPDPEGQLAQCTDSAGNVWFCPLSAKLLSATNTGVSNSASGAVSFTISSFADFNNSGNNVSAQVGGLEPPATANARQEFDWGLPFHFGRTVYVGIEGMSSRLGTGPYWAY